MKSLRVLGVACFICLGSAALMAQATPAKSGEVDVTTLLRETQKYVREAGYVGLVWWTPTSYWEVSAERAGMAPEKAKERYKSLAQYTMVIVAAGKLGIGNVDWFPELEIRDSVVLRDSKGIEYRPVDKVSGDAQGLASILRPVFANLLGNMGQNCFILFFPATDKIAEPIADPIRPGNFSVVIKNLIGGKDETIEWKLPLTSLSAPRYCPVGKERMEANWNYCPWHGVKLDNVSGSSTPAIAK